MLVASIIQLLVSIAVVIVGATQMGLCSKERFGDWGMVYGGFLFGCSAVTTAAIHGRQRRMAVVAIVLGSITSVVGLGIDGVSYFCVDLRGGANRGIETCQDHIGKFNSCQWVSEYRDGYAHLQDFGAGARLTLLVCLVLYLGIGVGVMTTALTEAGRIDLCQFEAALRELNDVNQTLEYRKRARRNRILTRYISEAKPEEGQHVGTKMMHFFGFGTDVEPIPVQDRKVKFVLPKGAAPSP